MTRRPSALARTAALAWLAWVVAVPLIVPWGLPAAAAPAAGHDYAGALAKSLLFYEAQRSGPHDPRYTWRVAWRQPAALTDGQDAGVNLSGGWFDAGDHVKFGLPMAYSAAMLGWSLHESPEGYRRSGQTPYLLDTLRFVLDYFLNAYQEGSPATAEDEVFYYQVGDAGADHAFWGPPEKMTMPRPSFACRAAAPCSEVTAGTAAALATGAIVFAEADPAYAATLREKAIRLYRFADTYQSGAGYTAANGFYTSFSGFWDELAWGAIWLYRLTGDRSYLDRAQAAILRSQDAIGWAHNWDNVSVGTRLLLAKWTGDPASIRAIEQHLDHWTDRMTRTPGGLAFLNQWGSLRYAATTSFLALVWAGHTADPAKSAKYRDFGLRQINYILGDNPRQSSYVVGHGTNPPRNPHHRAAHDSPTNNIADPPLNRHELTGALVGGPASADDFDWRDDRTDYIRNEVATDYNAGFTAALAEILEIGDPGTPPPTPLPTRTTPPAVATPTALPPVTATPTATAAPTTATPAGGHAVYLPSVVSARSD